MGKTLILTNYLILAFWWVVLASVGSPDGLGNSYFNLGVGLYSFVLSICLAIATYRYGDYLPHKPGVIVVSLGMSLFGLGSIFWFYYDVVFGINIPFPSIADLFYVFQFPFTVCGILLFSRRVRRHEGYINIYGFIGVLFKVFVFVFSMICLVFIVSRVFGEGNSFLEDFLLFYFPLESFSVLILSFVVLLQYFKSYLSSLCVWLGFMVVGEVFWFVADCLFLYGVYTSTFFNASFADFLFLTGVFLILFGLINAIEKSRKDGFISPEGPIFYQRMSQYVPFDLN